MVREVGEGDVAVVRDEDADDDRVGVDDDGDVGGVDDISVGTPLTRDSPVNKKYRFFM